MTEADKDDDGKEKVFVNEDTNDVRMLFAMQVQDGWKDDDESRVKRPPGEVLL
jgi:hypothetical protein